MWVEKGFLSEFYSQFLSCLACSNEGSHPFSRWDNGRTTGSIMTKLCTKHPWLTGFKFVQIRIMLFKSENT